MPLSTSASSLLRNLVTGKGVKWLNILGREAMKACEGIFRADQSQDF